jgi:hypothetical protein
MKALWEIILKEFSLIGILNVAYSPDFNPIELYFSMIKREFRNLKLKNFKEPFQNSCL